MSTPFSGKQFTFTQPDGTELWLKGWGNQHHAVFECLNGYTIVKDPITGFFTYADLSSDGETLLSTGVRTSARTKWRNVAPNSENTTRRRWMTCSKGW